MNSLNSLLHILCGFLCLVYESESVSPYVSVQHTPNVCLSIVLVVFVNGNCLSVNGVIDICMCVREIHSVY